MGISTKTELGYIIRDGEVTREIIKINDTDRQSGMEIIGVPGRGKSQFLSSLIHQDICKYYPVIVMDPHGDLVDHVIAQMPEEHVSRTYLLDLQDCREYPFSLNLFYCPDPTDEEQRDATRSQIMNVFTKLWPSELRQLNLPMVLRNVVVTLIENPGMTMLNIFDLFLDTSYRRSKTRNLKDEATKAFWRRYESMTERAQQEFTQPLITRLDTFLSESVIRNIMCQKDARVNFRRAIEGNKQEGNAHGEIILVKLPVHLPAYQQTAPIIGTVLLSLIVGAAFSFADIQPPHLRPGFSLYVDEFYNFSTDSFAILYKQARKYGARVTVAHQTLDQLKGDNESAILGADSIIAFKPIDDDAKKLASIFFDPQTKPTVAQVYWDVLDRIEHHPNEIIHTFYEDYVNPLRQEIKRLSRIVNALSYDDTEYQSPTPADKLSVLETHQKALEKLLVDAQRNQRINPDLLYAYLKKCAGWFDFGSLALLEHQIEGTQEQFEQLQERRGVFGGLSPEQLLDYYLAHFCSYYFPDGEATRYLPTSEIRTNNEFNYRVLSGGTRLLSQPTQTEARAVVDRVVAYHASLSVSAYREGLQEQVAQYRREAWDFICGMRKYMWQHIATIHKLRSTNTELRAAPAIQQFHAMCAEKITSPSFDTTQEVVYEQPFLTKEDMIRFVPAGKTTKSGLPIVRTEKDMRDLLTKELTNKKSNLPRHYRPDWKSPRYSEGELRWYVDKSTNGVIVDELEFFKVTYYFGSVRQFFIDVLKDVPVSYYRVSSVPIETDYFGYAYKYRRKFPEDDDSAFLGTGHERDEIVRYWKAAHLIPSYCEGGWFFPVDHIERWPNVFPYPIEKLTKHSNKDELWRHFKKAKEALTCDDNELLKQLGYPPERIDEEARMIQEKKDQWGTMDSFLALRRMEIYTFLQPLQEEISSVTGKLQRLERAYNESVSRREMVENTVSHICSLLIADPIGEKRTPKESDVAYTLKNLPARQTLVKVSGEIQEDPPRILHMRTADAPQANVRGVALEERIQRIREQTHAKYCRPRHQVEAELRSQSVQESEDTSVINDDLPEDARPARRKPL